MRKCCTQHGQNSRSLEELARQPVGFIPHLLAGKRPGSSNADEPVQPSVLGQNFGLIDQQADGRCLVLEYIGILAEVPGYR